MNPLPGFSFFSYKSNFLIPWLLFPIRTFMFIWAMVFLWIQAYGEERITENTLERLLAESERERAVAEEAIRAELDHETVSNLLNTFDTLPPSLSRSLERILSSGGPWIPALIEAVQEGKSGCRAAARMLSKALDHRPIRRELPPPGALATSFLDPFGNALPGEGKALYFPGTWPDRVHLCTFLDRVNEESLPAYAFVLSPELADNSAYILRSKPLEGAATLVMDHVLSDFGLGVTFLESIALVGPQGGSTFGQTGLDQRSDHVLLDRALKILAHPDSTGGARIASYKALAYLDLPGLYEGYYLELARGSYSPALDILLCVPCFPRFVAELVRRRDMAMISTLLRVYSRWEDTNPKGRALFRLLHVLPREWVSEAIQEGGLEKEPWAFLFKEIPEDLLMERIRAFMEHPDPSMTITGIKAAVLYAPTRPALSDELIKFFCGWTRDEPRAIPWIEACLRKSLFYRLKDRDIALLIKNRRTRTVGLELAMAKGDRASLRAIYKMILSGKGGDLKSVASAAVLENRLAGELSEEEGVASLLVTLDDSDVPPMAKACFAGLMVSISVDREIEAKAAHLLMDLIEEGGSSALVAAQMISFFSEGRIIPYLEDLEIALKEQKAEIISELKKSIIRSCDNSSLHAERIRLALKSQMNQDLNDSLALVASLTSLDSLHVAVDF